MARVSPGRYSFRNVVISRNTAIWYVWALPESDLEFSQGRGARKNLLKADVVKLLGHNELFMQSHSPLVALRPQRLFDGVTEVEDRMRKSVEATGLFV